MTAARSISTSTDITGPPVCDSSWAGAIVTPGSASGRALTQISESPLGYLWTGASTVVRSFLSNIKAVSHSSSINFTKS